MVDSLVTRAEVKNLDFFYGKTQALKKVNLRVYKNRVTALIGPSGCGKTTLLRCFNRMHDLYPGHNYSGEILLQPEKENILDRRLDPIAVRMKIGMVFQKPNPFPKTIFENVAYGLRIRGEPKSSLKESVEKALRQAALWDEVKDRLQTLAPRLSGGQQQRLCIARALAIQPELILFDEPTSALDPLSTAKLEELVTNLKKDVSIVIVTHNMQQAGRVSDFTGFMYIGEIIEFDTTDNIFTNPSNTLTEGYITGHFG